MNLYFESCKQLLDSAVKEARKNALRASAKERSDKFRKIRVEENALVSEFADFIAGKLHSSVKSFPDFSKAEPFYRELASFTVNLPEVKKALGHFSSAESLVKKLRVEHLRRMNDFKRRQKWSLFSIERKKFYARVSSIVRKLQPSVNVLSDSLRLLRSLPRIQPNCFNIVIAGFPNSGKSTMLKRLTGSNPEIAHYAFTTKSIMQGFFEERLARVQAFDTPGLLDRGPEERNSVEKKAAVALKHLAELVVFVADVSKDSEFSLQEQESLFGKLRDEFSGRPFCAVLNKCDIADPNLREGLSGFFKKEKIALFEDGEGFDNGLKDFIVEKALAKLRLSAGV